MRLVAAILMLLPAVACATHPMVVHTTKINLVWHEVEPRDIAKVCHTVLRKPSWPLWRTMGTVGCYVKRGDECHIYTMFVRDRAPLGTVGHELLHCAVGRFHDSEGNWVIKREPHGISE